MLDIETVFVWSSWVPHSECWRGNCIPHEPGLYRLRRVGQPCLDYIGQTGSGTMTLRKRLAMQAGVYAQEMPYTDPHTAGPALWALRHKTSAQYEVSVLPVTGTSQWRKGLEALAIALHRQQFGCSPTVNFGRMPSGFRRSSGNNRRLVLAGKRFRGGLCDSDDRYHVPGIPPVGPLTGDTQDSRWGGHKWSDWQPLDQTTDFPAATAQGLYRIRDAGKPGLLYIGEGIVTARLIAHRRKARKRGDTQGDVFGTAERLACSWVLNDAWLPHQRLELECDLIGSHLLVRSVVPPAQFIG
jgi:hypothetical protein